MTATLQGGPIIREGSKDIEGQREYNVSHIVRTDTVQDGPGVVGDTPGLPLIGSTWSFGNDSDPWAYCQPTMTIQVAEGESLRNPRIWQVDQVFSTKPLSRCQDQDVGNPILEPQKIGGSFVKFTTIPAFDKDDNPIVSSSWELIPTEFDANRPTVWIEQNVLSLGLPTFSEMVDTVNDATLWGLGPRRIKLSNVTWQRKLYGLCNYYYTRRFEFDVNFGTFDVVKADVGTRVLKAGGNKNDPRDFLKAKDDNDENMGVVLLDGDGSKADSQANAATITVQHYEESNFLLLGIPTVLSS